MYVEDKQSAATKFPDTDAAAGTQRVHRANAINGAGGAGNRSNHVSVDP